MRGLSLVATLLVLGGCASLGAWTGRAPARSTAAVVGDSEDFIVVVVAKERESAEVLARTHLGDATKAWMIEDFNGGARVFKIGRAHV